MARIVGTTLSTPITPARLLNIDIPSFELAGPAVVGKYEYILPAVPLTPSTSSNIRIAPRVLDDDIPLLELPPPAMADENETTSSQRVSCTPSPSSNVLRVSGRGFDLTDLPSPIRGPLRVTNFTAQDFDTESDEEGEAAINLPRDAGDSHSSDDDSTRTIEPLRQGSRLWVGLPEINHVHNRRFNRINMIHPGDERRRYEELIVRGGSGSTTFAGLVRVGSNIMRWCMKQSGSITAGLKRQTSRLFQKGGRGTDANQESGEEEDVELEDMSSDDTPLGSMSPEDDTALDQMSSESDIDVGAHMYRLVRVHARAQ